MKKVTAILACLLASFVGGFAAQSLPFARADVATDSLSVREIKAESIRLTAPGSKKSIALAVTESGVAGIWLTNEKTGRTLAMCDCPHEQSFFGIFNDYRTADGCNVALSTNGDEGVIQLIKGNKVDFITSK